MKKERMPLFVPLLWFFIAGWWIKDLCTDFYYKSTPEWLIAVHGVTAFVTLAAAVANLIRYKKDRIRENSR